ncbi:MAG: hypothetical protein EU542_08145 [Promethearchaeota archaeon]|nr:MAG: hypothetical protein EU542_08145 [Candidatus Lokiarchaeota archaeon]
MKELDKMNISILGDIPLDDDIVDSYCQATPLMDANSEFDKNGDGYKSFESIFQNLKNWIINQEESA